MPWLGNYIESIVWGAIGAVLGWLASGLVLDRSGEARIEYVAAGIFGAFIGGEFLVAMFTGQPPGITVISLAAAVAVSVIMLLLLTGLRKLIRKPPEKRKRSGGSRL